MEPQHIKNLLDKYFAAESTLEEEQDLRRYFSEEKDLPEQWMAYRALFGFYEQETEATYPLPIVVPKEQNRTYGWATSAAMIAAIAGLFFWFSNQNTTRLEKEPQNYALAVSNTQDLLQMMTNAVHSSTKQLSYLNELNTTQNQILKK